MTNPGTITAHTPTPDLLDIIDRHTAFAAGADSMGDFSDQAAIVMAAATQLASRVRKLINT